MLKTTIAVSDRCLLPPKAEDVVTTSVEDQHLCKSFLFITPKAEDEHRCLLSLLITPSAEDLR